ncbi:MAG: outer membrane protein assembly factor BamD [Verrucomicrobiales bacterium]
MTFSSFIFSKNPARRPWAAVGISCITLLMLTSVAFGQSAPDDLAAAERLAAEGSTGRAVQQFRNLHRRYAGSNEAATGLFRAAELLEQQNDYRRAFEVLQTLLEEYPRSPDFELAVESQFRIATLYMEGDVKGRFLGIPTGTAHGRAEEMFKTVLEIAPYTRIAPMAQFNLGLVQQKQAKSAEAIRSFQAVIDKYPTSPVAADAQFQIGYVYLQTAGDGQYDQTAADRAREAFQDFLIRYPQHEKSSQAQANLAEIEGRATESLISVARFYERRRNFRAAIIYYRRVLAEQPGTPEAAEADAKIPQLEAMLSGEDSSATAPVPTTPEPVVEATRPERVTAPEPVETADILPTPPAAAPTPEPVEVPEIAQPEPIAGEPTTTTVDVVETEQPPAPAAAEATPAPRPTAPQPRSQAQTAPDEEEETYKGATQLERDLARRRAEILRRSQAEGGDLRPPQPRSSQDDLQPVPSQPAQ